MSTILSIICAVLAGLLLGGKNPILFGLMVWCGLYAVMPYVPVKTGGAP